MTPWLRYLIAFVVACHGLTYCLFGFLAPAQMKEWNGTSRLLGSVLKPDGIRALVPVLHLIAGVAILACALAIAFAPSAPGWWPPLAILGAVASLAAFAVFWDGRARYVVEQGGIGLALSLILVAAALGFSSAFN